MAPGQTVCVIAWSVDKETLMSLTEEIKEIMRAESKQEKSSRLAVVAFRFEINQTLPVNEAIEAASLLMDYAFAEVDQGLRDDLYNAVDDALFYQHVGKY